MKKSTKVNNKIEIIFKILHGICYFLSGVLILLIILMGVHGCFSSSVETFEPEKNQLLDKNHAVNSFSINDSLGYALRTGDDLKKPKEVEVFGRYQTTYTVSLGSSSSAVVRDSNNSLKMLDENWTIIFNLRSPLQNGDYIRFETPNWTRQYDVSIVENTFWLSYFHNPEDYSYEEVYLPMSEGYNASNFDKFRFDINRYFYKLPFVDYKLNVNWKPSQFIPSIEGNGSYFRIGSQSSNPNYGLNNKFVNNPIYGNSLKIFDSGLFSVNGNLYTDLLLHVQVLSHPDIYVYPDNYSDSIHTSSSASAIDVYFIDFVYAYNNSSERYEIVYSIPYDDIENVYHVYMFEAGFGNEFKSVFRLFDRNLETKTINGFTNGTVFENESFVITNGGGITSDDYLFTALDGVFTLIGSAFSGINGLLQIQIGAGITLGAFFLIPLTAFIIMTIIHLFKR